MSQTTRTTNTDEDSTAREYIFSDIIEHVDGQDDADELLQESISAAVQRALDDNETPVEVTLTAEITPHGGGDR